MARQDSGLQKNAGRAQLESSTGVPPDSRVGVPVPAPRTREAASKPQASLGPSLIDDIERRFSCTTETTETGRRYHLPNPLHDSGHLQETVTEAKRTLELEPQAALPYALLALSYADLGQKDEAMKAAQNALRLGGDSGSVIATAASALARAGQPGRARQALNKALELEKRQYVCRFLVGAVYLDLGETDQAYQSLEKAFLQRTS